jgi:hypothetical protein
VVPGTKVHLLLDIHHPIREPVVEEEVVVHAKHWTLPVSLPVVVAVQVTVAAAVAQVVAVTAVAILAEMAAQAETLVSVAAVVGKVSRVLVD